MKKYLIVVLISIFAWISSVSAGEDTDAICNDDSQYWLIHKSIQVSYPDEETSVERIIKKNDSPYNGMLEISREYNTLYYVVNIRDKENPRSFSRSELYSYNCKTKSPKQLLKISIDHKNSEHSYDVSNLDGNNLILIWMTEPGMIEWTIRKIIGFNISSNIKIFTIKKAFENLYIDGFVSGKSAWYLYFTDSSSATINSDSLNELYSIDKKSKKITKL
jgi:hypothetical protein